MIRANPISSLRSSLAGQHAARLDETPRIRYASWGGGRLAAGGAGAAAGDVAQRTDSIRGSRRRDAILRQSISPASSKPSALSREKPTRLPPRKRRCAPRHRTRRRCLPKRSRASRSRLRHQRGRLGVGTTRRRRLCRLRAGKRAWRPRSSADPQGDGAAHARLSRPFDQASADRDALVRLPTRHCAHG